MHFVSQQIPLYKKLYYLWNTEYLWTNFFLQLLWRKFARDKMHSVHCAV